VFKGYWKGYPVAVRFPALKVPVGEDQRKQFIEASAISAVVHPNIVTSYGCCKKDQLCLVMELMNLGSLKQWLVKTPAGVQAMYIPRIALDIARGVDYIHSKHICHGNLKSSNILLKGELLDQGLIANLEVKIGDLGVIPDHLLKKADSEHFLAPEYFRTKYNSYEADVYSFGKILCHLFSEGKEEPKSPQEVINTSQYLQIWDPKWKELIVGCTQLDAAKRPRFSDIVDSLVSLLDSSKL
jgi:serine/threonine protein kinase